jgi:DNA primase
MQTKPDIIEIIEREGFTPKRKGPVYWFSCPFHTDRTPSMKIDPKRQTFFCFSCQSGGDVIAFIQRLHGLSFKDALSHLNITPGRPIWINPKERTKRALLKTFSEWQDSYHRQLCRERRAFVALTRNLTTIEQVELRAWIFDEMPRIDYHLDVLFDGTDEEKYHLYQGVKENDNI